MHEPDYDISRVLVSMPGRVGVTVDLSGRLLRRQSPRRHNWEQVGEFKPDGTVDTGGLPYTAQQLVVAFHNAWALRLENVHGALDFHWGDDRHLVPSYTRIVADAADGILAAETDGQLVEYLQTWEGGENSPARRAQILRAGLMAGTPLYRDRPAETLAAGLAVLEAAEQRHWPTGTALKARLPTRRRRR